MLQKLLCGIGVLAPGLSILIVTQTTLARQWTQTSAPTNYWQCIAISADGSKLVAGQYPGGIYVSTNSGGTWTPTTATNEYWTSVASSADGRKLLAAAADISGSNPGGVFTSTNSGSTWSSNNVPQMYWGSAASSGDGNTLVAVAPINGSQVPPGVIVTSTNGGMNWTTNVLTNVFSSHISFQPVGVAVSADGRKMFVAAPFGNFRSTNSGTTWAQQTNGPETVGPMVYSYASPSQYIASSADGTKVVLCELKDLFDNPAPIFVSTNSGNTWNATSVSNEWGFVTMSANGNTIIAMTSPIQPVGPMYISTDCGNTWTTNGPIATWSAAASSADGGKLSAAAQGDANNDMASGPIYVSQSVVAPQMAIGSAKGNASLSWLVPSTNFVLQQSANLAGWADVTNSPVLNQSDLQNEVMLPSTNSAGFYRLKTP